jgi:hypothetical protein
VIGLTFLVYDHQQHPKRCEILLEWCCDSTSSGHEAEVAEQLVVAALKVMQLEQNVCVVREGDRTTVKGQLRLTTLPAAGGDRNQ